MAGGRRILDFGFWILDWLMTNLKLNGQEVKVLLLLVFTLSKSPNSCLAPGDCKSLLCSPNPPTRIKSLDFP